VITDALKLSIYFGDAATVGSELASQALMRRFAERDVRVAALLRGVEGFGIHRRIHAERFPDNSTDLPLLAVMQVELLNRTRWKTRIELASAIHDYIELFHNTTRRHTALGMLTPTEYEHAHSTTHPTG
jgi:PII-like signaling protein